MLRNDYAGTGYINGGRKQITAWLYRSLLDNKPYDQFVRELVNPTPESAGFADGFVWRGQVNASQRPELQFAQNVGQVFLGVNLKCALVPRQLHRQLEAHRFVRPGGDLQQRAARDSSLRRADRENGRGVFSVFRAGSVDPQAPREERLAKLADLMTSSDNGRLTRTIVNRLWDRLMGRGIVFPVDALASRPWSEDLLDFLAADLSDHGYDLKQTLRLVTTSQVYGSQSVAWDPSAPANEYVFAGPAPKRMTAEQFVDAIVGKSPASHQGDGGG